MIIDPEALVEVLREVVRLAGSQRAAAEALGITRPYVTRMLQGRIGKAIGGKILKRIMHLLHPDGSLYRDVLLHDDDPTRYRRLVRTFERAVIDPAAVARVDQYRLWLARRLRRYRQGNSGRQVVKLHTHLKKHRSYRSYFATFQAKMLARGFAADDPRVVLAEWRAVEPLLDAQDSGGIELSWAELDDAGRLTRYLRSALDREAVLLDRASSGAARARAAGGGKK
jgi:hypothetical protein